MTTERKWKRGDIGPDGLVFWAYQKGRKNGERWITPSKLEEMKKKASEWYRKIYAENPEKFREKSRNEYYRNYADSPQKFIQKNRKWRESNREKMRENDRKSYAKQRNQAAADQFFIMAGAAESISQLK